MAGTKVKVKVTQGKSTISPPRTNFFTLPLVVTSLNATIWADYFQMLEVLNRCISMFAARNTTY